MLGASLVDEHSIAALAAEHNQLLNALLLAADRNKVELLVPAAAPALRSGGGVHCGSQTCQPDLRFWAQSLIASFRISSLRCFSSGGSPLGITSPKVTSSAWLQRS